MKIQKNTQLRKCVANAILEYMRDPSAFRDGCLYGTLGAAYVCGEMWTAQYSRIIANHRLYAK